MLFIKFFLLSPTGAGDGRKERAGERGEFLLLPRETSPRRRLLLPPLLLRADDDDARVRDLFTLFSSLSLSLSLEIVWRLSV